MGFKIRGGIASKGEVLVEDGALLVTDTSPAAEEGYIYLRDEKANGTDAGAASSGSYKARDLNTIVSDTDNNVVSLISNEFVLVAGSYQAEIRAPATNVGVHKVRLRNVTAGSTILVGSNARSFVGGLIQTDGWVYGRFTVAAGQSLSVEHRVTTDNVSADGLGDAASFGDPEIYTEVILLRVA